MGSFGKSWEIHNAGRRGTLADEMKPNPSFRSGQTTHRARSLPPPSRKIRGKIADVRRVASQHHTCSSRYPPRQSGSAPEWQGTRGDRGRISQPISTHAQSGVSQPPMYFGILLLTLNDDLLLRRSEEDEIIVTAPIWMSPLRPLVARKDALNDQLRQSLSEMITPLCSLLLAANPEWPLRNPPGLAGRSRITE
jgi:hypothetical protein